MSTSGVSSFVEMPDGRRLSYASWGDPAGSPLVYFHGCPGSRFNGALLHVAAARVGVHLICPERPGYGLSDPLPDRTLIGWTEDVRALADSFNLDRFAVFGVSGGGPHAIACAAKIPDRLSHVSVLSGLGPLDAPGSTDGMDRMPRFVWRARPAAQRVLLRIGATLSPWAPDAALLPIVRDEPARRFFESDEARRNFVRALREGLRHGGAGMATEVAMLSRPWNLDLKQIDFPIRIWHGVLDGNCPISMAKFVASSLPRCESSFFEGEGHMCYFHHLDQLFRPVRKHRAEAREPVPPSWGR